MSAYSAFLGTKTKKLPSRHIQCRDRSVKYSSAVPPRLTHKRPLTVYLHTPVPLTQNHSVSHTYEASALSARHSPDIVQLALGSPFTHAVTAALAPTGGSLKMNSRSYLLFLIGLHYNITPKPLCQEVFRKFLHTLYGKLFLI